ncbi:MAG TPA: hypothetical protein VMW32_05400, partial [Bacteroidales bacterium]|nr:hypothetical protein [Bacteroidales bacterium]
MAIFQNKLYFIPFIYIVLSCSNKPHGNVTDTGRLPVIDPDYSEIIIPPNIAPLNFIIKEVGAAFFVRFSAASKAVIETGSGNGIIRIPGKKWKKMLETCKGQEFNIDVYIRDKKGEWSKFRTISNKIAAEPIDPYLSYRLLYPGYESWSELSIKQRNLTDFREHSIIENILVEENCINCHSYNNGKTDDFLFHMRGTLGGTYFYSGGEFRKTNLK